ncbi:MAG: hypothetical protein NBKEAIPA_02537 [Nitrospirae bacterium]|nr:MAG: hypothetical protein UZ03_NOB001000548 [Nitrospira sp. OLB3]MBV6470621.1 hypothetical protein [Nitrospirota bacterium]MCE7965438.1 hypothetical protein [Nitrospira sp. NTP2]MCK6493064.1 hypothetical protein [Nitrospira sp.]MEB2338412.1 hypothetical protein [Nitrospirales bacterium]
MLKITSVTTQQAPRLILEGSVSGPWVAELERVWRTVLQSGATSPVVDLSGITFIAGEGKALLSRMWRDGATLIANGCCTRHIVEEITGGASASPSAGSAAR